MIPSMKLNIFLKLWLKVEIFKCLGIVVFLLIVYKSIHAHRNYIELQLQKRLASYLSCESMSI
jgi:hypothetical protein